MFKYYLNIIRPQLLHKLNTKNIPEIKQIAFNIYLDSENEKYIIYFYNICVLLTLITGKFLKVKKFNKNYENKKIHLQIILKKEEMYDFLEVFSSMLLPLFQNYNMPLRLKNFDNFGNYYYQISYSDPVFTSKNIITSWSSSNKINILFFMETRNIYYSFLLLQYLNFKWY